MEEPQNNEDLKREIAVQIDDLFRFLGQIPSDDPAVHNARSSFVKLSVLISKALDIPLQ